MHKFPRSTWTPWCSTWYWNNRGLHHYRMDEATPWWWLSHFGLCHWEEVDWWRQMDKSNTCAYSRAYT